MFKNQLKVFGLCLILITIGALTAKQALSDSLSLTVPVYTHHIQHTGNYDYVEGFANRAIGFDLTIGDFDYTMAYVVKNSLAKKSLYGVVSHYFVGNDNLKFGVGAMAATGGYERNVIASPVLVIKAGYLRLITTYPAAKIAGFQADVISVQAVIPIANW